MNENRIVSFQGWLGANSDMLGRSVFPVAEMLPCPSFEEALGAVNEGRANLALIPIENSIAGRVADVHHLLPGSGLRIIGEHFMPINHHLMALPGTKIEEIREVHSHVHALGQCRAWLHANKLTPIVHADTAGAARMVSEQRNTGLAAISTKLAAELYGLEILVSNIEDTANNVTRFVVLAPSHALHATPGKPMITSFVFEVKSVPAALYKVLGGFATNGINMTKLESYMLPGQIQQTQFYADVEGHPEDKGMKLALEELSFFSKNLDILGVYPASPFRRQNGPSASA